MNKIELLQAAQNAFIFFPIIGLLGTMVSVYRTTKSRDTTSLPDLSCLLVHGTVVVLLCGISLFVSSFLGNSILIESVKTTEITQENKQIITQALQSNPVNITDKQNRLLSRDILRSNMTDKNKNDLLDVISDQREAYRESLEKPSELAEIKNYLVYIFIALVLILLSPIIVVVHKGK